MPDLFFNRMTLNFFTIINQFTILDQREGKLPQNGSRFYNILLFNCVNDSAERYAAVPSLLKSRSDAGPLFDEMTQKWPVILYGHFCVKILAPKF